MSQALFTAMSGLNAGTEQLTVVSDNVANMNTTAYKTSRVDFQDVWYQTATTGTNSTYNSGGTNPYQIGVGVKSASITKDFGASSVNTTGRTEDLAIQGSGWFSVLNSDGQVLLTRDGTFALDENGYLCTASGCKVLGMDDCVSTSACTTPIKFPTQIKVKEDPTPVDDLLRLDVKEWNNCQLTGGKFKVTAIGTDVDATPHEFIVDLGDITHCTVQDIVDRINNTTGISDYLTAGMEAGKITFTTTGNAKSLGFESIEGGSNFPKATEIVSSPLINGNTYKSKDLNISAVISQVEDVTAETTKNYKSFSVGQDGLVTVTYSDGSCLTVNSNDNGATYFTYTNANGIIINDDVLNSGQSPLYVDPNVLEKANMQLQIVKVLNDGGLVAAGSNMYEIGVNCGDVLYTAANVNGVGAIASGALETSNVDLAQQFSNMILAQRLVQANSQVFSSANSILETLVYLGRG